MYVNVRFGEYMSLLRINPVKRAFMTAVLAACAMPAHARDIEGTRLDQNCASTLMLSDVADSTKPIVMHDIEFVVYPETIPDNFTGCQVVWLGNGHRLATKHYESGKLSWMRGQEPKEVRPFFCVYHQGVLDVGESFNAARCPESAAEVQ